MASMSRGRFFFHHWGMGAGRDGGQQSILAINQCRRIIAGDLEVVPVRDGVGGAGFDAISAKDTAVVVDVVDLGIALAAADAGLAGVLGSLDVNAIGWTGRGAEKAGYALLQPVLIPLQDVYTAKALLQFGRLVGIVLRHRGRHHLFESDAHTLGD